MKKGGGGVETRKFSERDRKEQSVTKTLFNRRDIFEVSFISQVNVGKKCRNKTVFQTYGLQRMQFSNKKNGTKIHFG